MVSIRNTVSSEKSTWFFKVYPYTADKAVRAMILAGGIWTKETSNSGMWEI